MDALTSNINWIAVGGGAVVAFLLGWLWYSPKLFGVKWAEGVGVSLDKAGNMPVAAMLTQTIGTFLLAWVLAVAAATGGLGLAVLIVATIVCLMVASGYFCQKSGYAIATEAGFVIAMAVIMIGAQAVL